MPVLTFGNGPQVVIIVGRVHPGETGASYMMKGVIDYLVGPSIGARILRDNLNYRKYLKIT